MASYRGSGLSKQEYDRRRKVIEESKDAYSKQYNTPQKTSGGGGGQAPSQAIETKYYFNPKTGMRTYSAIGQAPSAEYQEVSQATYQAIGDTDVSKLSRTELESKVKQMQSSASEKDKFAVEVYQSKIAAIKQPELIADRNKRMADTFQKQGYQISKTGQGTVATRYENGIKRQVLIQPSGEVSIQTTPEAKVMTGMATTRTAYGTQQVGVPARGEKAEIRLATEEEKKAERVRIIEQARTSNVPFIKREKISYKADKSKPLVGQPEYERITKSYKVPEKVEKAKEVIFKSAKTAADTGTMYADIGIKSYTQAKSYLFGAKGKLPQVGKKYGVVQQKVSMKFASESSSSAETIALGREATEGKGFKSKLYGAGLLTYGGITYVGMKAFKGASSIFISPKETVEGFGYMVRHPIKSTTAMAGSFVADPVGTSAELGGGLVGFRVAGGIGKKFIAQPIISKLSPNYVKYESSGIVVEPSVSVPQKLGYLKSMESTSVPTVHTTFFNLKSGTTIKPAATERLAGWRKAIDQRNFYTSSPITQMGEQIPVAYGGYIGIGEGTSGSRISFSIMPKPARAYIFRDTFISKTPASVAAKDIKSVVKYQTETAGTFVTAENIKGISTEGQFTTSAGLENRPLMQIQHVGGELQGKWTYYPETKPVPAVLGKSKFVESAWNLVTSKKTKIKLYEAEFKQVGSAASIKDIDQSVSVDKITSSQGKQPISVASSISKGAIAGSSFAARQPTPMSSSMIQSKPSVPVSISKLGSSSTVKSSAPSFSSSKVPSRSSPVSPSRSSYSSSASSSMSASSSADSISSSLSSMKSSPSLKLSSRSSYASKPSKSAYSSSSQLMSSTFKPPISPRLPSSGTPDNIAYNVLAKRYGKYKLIGSNLPKGKALQSGVEYSKRTLGASFKLMPTGKTGVSDISFNVNPTEFRDYKIEKGKKKFTPLEYIQKRKFRLSSGSEIREIQEAKISSIRMRF